MSDTDLLAHTPLTEFFRDRLHDTVVRQHLDLTEAAEYYVVCLLCGFLHTDAWLETAPSGAQRAPLLAALLTQALAAPPGPAQERAWQRLGDVALFSAGFFAHGYARCLVDIDYPISLGGQAYESLGASARSVGLRPVRPVFLELAAKFVGVVDALNELAEAARPASVEDRLRFYEIWQKTGSRRARQKLVGLGIEPVPAGPLHRPQ